MRYIGLDVHKRVIEACLLADDGEIVARKRFELTGEKLDEFIAGHLQKTDRVILEATTNTWAVAERLAAYVAEVVVSNPLQTKAIAQAKIKTDKVDAEVLAHLLRLDYVPRVWQPDEATKRLRRLCSRRSALIGQRTAVKNRLHAVLAMRLLCCPYEDLFGKDGLCWLRQVQVDEDGRLLLDSDLRLLEALDKEIGLLDEVLAKKGYSDSRVSLLLTLPGVNVAVAESLLAALGDVDRFRDGDHAAGYLGLVPRIKQSAQRCYHGPITKRGNRQARWMLVQAAQHVSRHPGPLGHFFRRLKRKKCHNIAVVATARKLVTIALKMLKNNEPYRYAQPRSTEEKLRKLRVKATGKKRKSGPKKGTPPLRTGGMRTKTVRSLAEVYESEGLPPLPAPPPAEAKTVAQSGCREFVERIGQTQRLVRKRKAPTNDNG